MPKFYLSRTEYDTYMTTIEADSEEDAIAKAEELWEQAGSENFDWTNGSVDDWECEEAD
jgi:hypothetical protein